MKFYDSLLQSLREIKTSFKEDPLTNTNVSGAIAGELTIITVLLLSTILLARINVLLALAVFLVLLAFVSLNLPLVPKVIREQNDSLDTMLFYVILTLGILIPIIYWGVKYV